MFAASVVSPFYGTDIARVLGYGFAKMLRLAGLSL